MPKFQVGVDIFNDKEFVIDDDNYAGAYIDDNGILNIEMVKNDETSVEYLINDNNIVYQCLIICIIIFVIIVVLFCICITSDVIRAKYNQNRIFVIHTKTYKDGGEAKNMWDYFMMYMRYIKG